METIRLNNIVLQNLTSDDGLRSIINFFLEPSYLHDEALTLSQLEDESFVNGMISECKRRYDEYIDDFPYHLIPQLNDHLIKMCLLQKYVSLKTEQEN